MIPSTANRSSRRNLLRQWAGAIATAVMLREVEAQAPNPEPRGRELRPRLVKEFRDAYLLAVAPDSRKVCLYFTKNPIDKFTYAGGKWNYEGGPSKDGQSRVEVIEMSTWKALCSTNPLQHASSASFSSDSEHLYVGTDSLENDTETTQHLAIDLQHKTVTSHLQRSRLHEPFYRYYALDGQTLLCTESIFNKFVRQESLLLVSLPYYTELARVPFSLARVREVSGRDYLTTSGDGKLIYYGVDHMVICRRSSDLGLLWTRETPPNFKAGVMFLSTTPTGNRVAAVVLDTVYIADQRRFYIEIYSGEDGTTVAKLPLNGFQGIALSPDGSIIAVGKTLPKSGRFTLTAELYEITSGRLVAVVEDDTFEKLDLLHIGGFDAHGLAFTPDGKYLVTSITGHTKVWAL